MPSFFSSYARELFAHAVRAETTVPWSSIIRMAIITARTSFNIILFSVKCAPAGGEARLFCEQDRGEGGDQGACVREAVDMVARSGHITIS